jgi:DHA2 family multidrug resistance protein
MIVTLAVTAAVGLAALVVWEWRRDDPIVDVRLFRNLNFFSASAMMFVAGIMMFSGLVMIPQYLQLLMGYSSQQAGLVLSGGGVVLLILMPIVGTLTTKFPAKYIIATGWFLTSAAMFYSARHLDLEISFWSAALLRVVQVVGMPLLFVPIILISYVGLPVEKSNSIAGLVSFMRNIGSSIGTSMVTSLVARQAQVHQVDLVAHTTPASPAFNAAVSGMAYRLSASGADASRATMQAYGEVYRAVIAQATALAYIDTFWILAMGAAVMVPLSFALKRNDPGGGGAVVHD